jgi:hypothetical protein
LSEQDQTSITRRRVLEAATGAASALAGCNGIQEDDSSSNDDSKNNSSGVPNETENNSTNKKMILKENLQRIKRKKKVLKMSLNGETSLKGREQRLLKE